MLLAFLDEALGIDDPAQVALTVFIGYLQHLAQTLVVIW